MKKAVSPASPTPSQLITQQIADLGDWRGPMLGRLRQLIPAASPGLVEEWKWGAALKDPHGLFNAGLEANATRAIDLHQGDKIDETA